MNLQLIVSEAFGTAMEASASTSVPRLAAASPSSGPLPSSSATEVDKWFRQYTLVLSDAVTQWKDRSSSERLTIVKRLQLVLTQRMSPSSSTFSSSAASNSCLLTLHTFSHLLSRDSASDPSFMRWTRHAKFSEQLLIALLQLFQLCLSSSGTVRVVENSHRFSFAFLIAQLNSLAADESALPIRRHALLTLVALAHVIQPSLLAAFLPGIVSSTLSILTKSPRLHSTLAITGLNLLTVIIRRAINPSKKQPLSVSEKLASLSLSSSSPPPAPPPAPSLSLSETEDKLNKTNSTTLSRNRPRLPNSLNYKPGASPSKQLSRDSSLHIDIHNDEWISKTTSNFLPRLKPIVLSRQGPRFHSLASVRAAYVRFLSFVIEQDHLILDDVHQSFFKMALFECCIHSYMTVSQLGVDVLRKFFKRHGRIHFERAIVACIRFANHQQTDSPTRSPIDIDVDSLKQLAGTATDLDHYFHHRISVNDNKDEFSLVIFSACLAVLIPQQPSNTRECNDDEDLYVIPLARLQAFMYRVGVMSFVDMLLALHQRLWNPSRVDRIATEEALNNHVIQFANRLGSIGLLGCVYDPLTALASTGSVNQIQADNRGPPLSSTETETGIGGASTSVTSHLARDDGPDMEMDMNSFKIRAHSSLILQAVVESAFKNAIHNGSEKQGYYIKQCSKEVIELMSRLFVPNSQHHHVDDTMITLKLSLTSQLESLATLLSRSTFQNRPSRQRQRRIGSDLILVFLMHLLRDATHGDPIIKPVAIDALTHIAKCDGLGSYRMLLLKHINFIVSRVIWHLHQPWAVNVLKFVVGPTPDDVGTETSLLLNKTLKSICDTMSAVSDERAIQMLASIKAVLSIAIIQKQSSPQLDHTVNEEEDVNSSVDKDLLEVHRTLFQYCTEDDWDEDDIKLMELSKFIDSDRFIPGNDLFDGFGDDNKESDMNDEGVEANKGDTQPDLNVSSFEDIAQYALTGTQDLLVGRSWTVRAAALECITLGVRYLKRRKKLLFPHVAKLLPLLPSQLDCIGSRQESLLTSGERMFNAMKQRRNAKHISDTIYELNDKAAHLPVVINLCQSIASLAECAGVFIRDRFIRLIYPKLVPLLEVITHFPTLIVVTASDNTQVDAMPSHGTMSAADAVLEAFASIAQFTPATLAPYTSGIIRAVAPLLDADKMHPETIAQAYPSRFQNQNLLRAEIERWDHRVECVSRIIGGFVIANEAETFCSLLCVDAHAGDVLKSGHDELFDIFM